MEGAVEAAGGGGGEEEKIVVSVRLRPLNAKEIARNEASDWECINETTIIFRDSLPAAYTFDRVFGCECPTKQVYEEGAKEVALSVVSGINSSIFAYGQTSSGKTYTMNGITEHTVSDIYEYVKKHEERAFILKFSAMEIYNEAVKDLLSMESTPLRLLDDPERGTIVEKLTEETLRDWNHLRQLLSVCEAQRQIGETLLNEMSSRSHQILRLTVESSAREFLGKDNSSTLVASVNFVDLAGSERASLALSSGTRLKEGCHINKSLLTLGTVIRKLSKGRNGHIPYRDSKLTRILQPSLGGNARTAIICTICPARSHIEQSRNTLLFASCAKEVVTSARVNVVMPDKALVKHLQKELARLENELRYPGSGPSMCHLEVLLREKGAQIKKMEKEINELTQERDLAQSRLEDLLQLVGKDRASIQWEETSHISISNVPNSCKDLLSTSELSCVDYNALDFGTIKFHTPLGSDNHMEHYEHSDKPKKQDDSSPRYSISSSMFCILTPHHGEEEIVQDRHEYFEDHCKEVRCIETDQPIKNEDPNFLLTGGSENLLPLTKNSAEPRYHETKPEGQMVRRPSNTNPSFITLEQHLQIVRKTLQNLKKPYPNELSPWSVRDTSRPKGLVLLRSKSCREDLISSSSEWLQESEQNDTTPSCSSLRDFPGKPEAFRRRHLLNYDAQSEMASGDGPEASDPGKSNYVYKEWNAKTTYKGDGTVIRDFVAELEMTQFDNQKQLIDDQEMDQSAKDVGLDPTLIAKESPLRWPLEFEKKQQQIIELWHACNVSLVHRTCFFLLFKGDPLDSIYMEVEIRRLSFLKEAFSRGNIGIASKGGQNTTLIASMKNLRRERGMLCRLMRKRMSPEERMSLYTKWRIALDSKHRRLQVARRLWTETGDKEHVRESASVIVKLIGLLGPGQALKEMFGLSFTPQQSYQSYYSWKR